MNRRRFAAMVATAAAVTSGCGNDGGGLLGTLERDRVELVAEAQEPIVELAVREGEVVAAGAILLKLDASAVESRLAEARAVAQQAERRLAELTAGARRETVREARAVAEGAAARALAESREFDRIEKLVAERMLPDASLDRQRALRDGAAADQRAAAEQLAELVHGTRAEVIEQAAAALAAARAQVSGLELSLARHTVRAPRAGAVDALPYELGERPPQGAPVAVLLGDGQPYARVFIPESRRATVAAGTQAIIRIDGTEHDWKGEVRYVSSEAAFTPYYALNARERSRLAYLAEVVLTEADAATLPTGLPVEVILAEAGNGS